MPEAEAIRITHKALEAGINLIDTADFHNTSKWMKAHVQGARVEDAPAVV